jgi:hypothetical protein
MDPTQIGIQECQRERGDSLPRTFRLPRRRPRESRWTIMASCLRTALGAAILLVLVASTLTTLTIPTEHSHDGPQLFINGENNIQRRLQDAPFRNGSGKFHGSAWKEHEVVDGLRNQEVVVVVTSTATKDEKLLRER